MTRKRKASTSQQDNEVVVKRENEQQIVGQSHHQIVGQCPSGPSPGASLSQPSPSTAPDPQPSPSTAPPQPSPPQSQTPRFEFDSELEFDGVYEQHQHANLHNDDPNDDPNSPFRPGDEIVEFGQFHAKVVGVRYYSGQVGVGEQTLLKRGNLSLNTYPQLDRTPQQVRQECNRCYFNSWYSNWTHSTRYCCSFSSLDG